MSHELEFGKIHIIEWLRTVDPNTGERDRPTGVEIHAKVREMLAEAKSPIPAILHRVGSRAAFLARLQRIEQDFDTTRRIPLLQIETHGDGDSIGLSDDDDLAWPKLMKALTPLNLATGCRLPVFLSSCEGMWGIRMAQAMERAPFFALMGPKRKVYPGEVVRGMCAFYRKVIVEQNGLKAMFYMNSIVNPDEDDTFRIYNCEQLFRDLWIWYLEGTSTEELIAPLLEEAVRKEQAERPRSEAEIGDLRAFARNYALDYPARFEEARRHFFMIDRFPENDARFKLMLTTVGDKLEIAD
jgi:hypothetical protein